ncbi:cysteine-rich CWC family protein [Luteolibacter sp. Populi]|uniref:cysteine-rich CWC family protein n=1 Tax=Luteolibacter sp. Populi TaxID=3230487 RepID=UPI003466908B
MSPPVPPEPLPNLACPACGSPNECAVAKSGDFATPCWCRQMTFPAGLLSTVAASRGTAACFCQSCFKAAASSRRHAGDDEVAGRTKKIESKPPEIRSIEK